jgi:hypothetical protein
MILFTFVLVDFGVSALGGQKRKKFSVAGYPFGSYRAGR